MHELCTLDSGVQASVETLALFVEFDHSIWRLYVEGEAEWLLHRGSFSKPEMSLDAFEEEVFLYSKLAFIIFSGNSTGYAVCFPQSNLVSDC